LLTWWEGFWLLEKTLWTTKYFEIGYIEGCRQQSREDVFHPRDEGREQEGQWILLY
jgi:hypothetical protein